MSAPPSRIAVLAADESHQQVLAMAAERDAALVRGDRIRAGLLALLGEQMAVGIDPILHADLPSDPPATITDAQLGRGQLVAAFIAGAALAAAGFLAAFLIA